MLNTIDQRELQHIFPRMTQLLKRYNDSYHRKVASVFEKASVEKFLAVSEDRQYILVCKAIVAIALSCGLRTTEIRDYIVKEE